MAYPEPTAYMVLVDHALLTRLTTTLESVERALLVSNEQLSNTRYYEADAAKYLGVEQKTLYHYRNRGLPFEKVGRIVSYLRKDLDAWRSAGRAKVAQIH